LARINSSEFLEKLSLGTCQKMSRWLNFSATKMETFLEDIDKDINAVKSKEADIIWERREIPKEEIHKFATYFQKAQKENFVQSISKYFKIIQIR
jgi:hypothetical protein